MQGNIFNELSISFYLNFNYWEIINTFIFLKGIKSCSTQTNYHSVIHEFIYNSLSECVRFKKSTANKDGITLVLKSYETQTYAFLMLMYNRRVMTSILKYSCDCYSKFNLQPILKSFHLINCTRERLPLQ